MNEPTHQWTIKNKLSRLSDFELAIQYETENANPNSTTWPFIAAEVHRRAAEDISALWIELVTLRERIGGNMPSEETS